MLPFILLSFFFPFSICTKWPLEHYQTENFTSLSIQVNQTGHTPNGHIFMGLIGDCSSPLSPMIITNSGDLVWHDRFPRPTGLETHNVRVQKYKGEDVLTYWEGYRSGFATGSGLGYGRVVLLNSDYTIKHTVCLSDVNIVVPNNKNGQPDCYLNAHESYITDRDTMVATVYNVTNADLTPFDGPKNGYIFDCLFYEIDISTGKVLFSWSAYKHVSLKESKYVGFDSETNLLEIKDKTVGVKKSNPWDWFHMNSVMPVSGGYIANSRMTWSMYMVNGSNGKVEWTLEGSKGGDFSLESDVFFSWQHMPRLVSKSAQTPTEGTAQISFFNNDNIGQLVDGTNASSGILLEIDTQKKHVTKIRDLQDPWAPIYAGAAGSYQALDDGGVLVGYGSQPWIKEFDKDGSVVWSAQYYIPNRHDSVGYCHTYRAYKYNWTATPTWPPRAAAVLKQGKKGQNLKIYMSWNGATHVDGYNIYTRSSSNDFSLATSNVPKKGFETMHEMDGSDDTKSFFMIEAVRNGKGVQNSSAVHVVKATSQASTSKIAIHTGISLIASIALSAFYYL